MKSVHILATLLTFSLILTACSPTLTLTPTIAFTTNNILGSSSTTIHRTPNGPVEEIRITRLYRPDNTHTPWTATLTIAIATPDGWASDPLLHALPLQPDIPTNITYRVTSAGNPHTLRIHWTPDALHLALNARQPHSVPAALHHAIHIHLTPTETFAPPIAPPTAPILININNSATSEITIPR